MTHQSSRHTIFGSLLAISCLYGSSVHAQKSLADTYKPQAEKLIAAGLADTDGYANLTYLCDHVGKRISGSEPLDRAIVWSADLMRKEGLANVTTQKVMVPKWVRGKESGAIVAPVTKPLHMLGLGMSVAAARRHHRGGLGRFELR